MRAFQRLPYMVRILGIATIVAFTVVISGALIMRFSVSNSPLQATNSPTPATTVTSQIQPCVLPTASIPTNSTPIALKNTTTIQQQLTSNQLSYGHFPYALADANQMIIVGSYAAGKEQRFESMNSEAGKALMRMIYAARDNGIWIVPVSGFRTVEQQQKLFQDQIKRRGSPEAAAKISAPPGYSEHHTGLALDLTDGKFPRQDISLEFEKSEAYRWLTRHGKEFGFELSFPRNNPQGVSFEPWHWRYVGSPDAVAIFATARR